jgi:hypothetical protein
MVFPWGISIGVESGGFSRKKNCGVFVAALHTKFLYVLVVLPFPGDIKNPKFNAVLSAHHLFAAPIPPAL